MGARKKKNKNQLVKTEKSFFWVLKIYLYLHAHPKNARVCVCARLLVDDVMTYRTVRNRNRRSVHTRRSSAERWAQTWLGWRSLLWQLEQRERRPPFQKTTTIQLCPAFCFSPQRKHLRNYESFQLKFLGRTCSLSISTKVTPTSVECRLLLCSSCSE